MTTIFSPQDCQKAQSLFTDPTSQGIFKARLSYSETGDAANIGQLVRHGSSRIAEKVALYGQTVYDLEVDFDDTIVIYGAGWIGQRHYAHYEHLAGICEVYLCDQNHSTLSQTLNLPILSPDTLRKDYAHCKLVVACSNHSVSLYHHFLAQGFSKEQLYLGSGADYVEQCFDPLLTWGQEEVFIDCGGFDGATSLHFAKHCPAYQKIMVFEPDGDNIRAIEKNFKEENITSYTLFQKGVWSESTTLRFSSGQQDVGTINPEGDTLLEVVSLDEVLASEAVTCIKMDIEGSEKEALQGAKQLIQTKRPKLAISIYHKPEDIVTLPLLLHSFVPDYSFFLRHYTGCEDDTILYAIPPQSPQQEGEHP